MDQQERLLDLNVGAIQHLAPSDHKINELGGKWLSLINFQVIKHGMKIQGMRTLLSSVASHETLVDRDYV